MEEIQEIPDGLRKLLEDAMRRPTIRRSRPRRMVSSGDVCEPIHTTHCVIEATNEVEARTLAAQMVGTQNGDWMGRPHPEVVLGVDILYCEV